MIRGAGSHNYTVAPGVTRKVRITLLSLVVGRQDGNVGIAELKIPGTEPQRALEVPADLPAGPAPGFSFTRGAQPRYACLPADGAVRCDASAARDGEEPDGIHRLFSTPAEQTFLVGGSVLPAGGGKNPVTLPGVTVASTSQLAGDPAAGGFAAVDGDAGTTWRPDVTDLRPDAHPGLARPEADFGAAHRGFAVERRAGRPGRWSWSAEPGSRTVQLDAGGSASFEPLDTDQLQIVLPGDDDDPGRARVVGIGSLELSGTDGLLPGPDPAFTVPCGSGPNVHLDGLDYRTSVQGTLSDITAHRPLALRMCRDSEGGISLPSGGHELRTDRSDSFVVQDLWLRPSVAATPPVHRAVQVGTWDAASRSVTVGPGAEAVLAIPENANAGWVATVDGRELARTRVDGWQQAWIVPAGAGGVVSLSFTPDSAYRMSLLIGAFAVVLLLSGVFWPARRRPFPVLPGGSLVPVVLIGLLVALGGMLPVVLLIACLLARQF